MANTLQKPWGVTVQISEVKIRQISCKNPGEHPAEGHIEIYGPEVAGNEGEGTPRGTLLEFTDFSCKHFHLLFNILLWGGNSCIKKVRLGPKKNRRPIENRHLAPTLKNFTF